jgi:hypothetical protein
MDPILARLRVPPWPWFRAPASPSCMEQVLVERRDEITPEGRRVDPRAGGRNRGDLTPRHEPASAVGERAQLGHRCAVASYHEAGAGLHGRKDLRVLVTQVTLGNDMANGTAHAQSVAKSATGRYNVACRRSAGGEDAPSWPTSGSALPTDGWHVPADAAQDSGPAKAEGARPPSVHLLRNGGARPTAGSGESQHCPDSALRRPMPSRPLAAATCSELALAERWY